MFALGRTFLSLLVATSVVLSCSGSSNGPGVSGGDGGAPGADGGTAPSGDGGGTPGTTLAPPTKTGNAIVDRLGAAAASCGKQSMFTVPGGWEIVAVGDKGCTVWVPPGWVIEGAYTGLATAMRDASGTEGFLGIAGISERSACDPATVRDGVLNGFAEKGFATPKVLWHHEQTDSFGGTAWPTGHTVFSTSAGETAVVGYLWLLTTATVIACDVVGLGFWEPVAVIERDTCTLTQVINSVKCPSGGSSCDDADCNAQCQRDGSAGGACSPEGNCSCY
jgi:hypothetical protein